MHFMAVKKSRQFAGCVIYLLKGSAFTTVKRDVKL